MPLSIDIKPLGALAEYTIKPILDDVIYVVDELEKKGLKLDTDRLERALARCMGLYIFHTFMTFGAQIVCTWLVCFTAWKILH